MTKLHCSASAGALALALLAAPALADTTVSTDTTTALATSSAGAVTVTTDGSITRSSGTGITVDSNASVTMDGTIDMGGADGATAIGIEAGTTSSIAIGEDGVISVLEDYVADDDNSDGTADSAIASASNRYAVHVSGAAAGTILNEGTITVEGLNSGGIVLDGDWTGDVTNAGSITVIGDNSTAIATRGVDGNVVVEGTVVATGTGATALAVDGDVSGTVRIQGAVTKGYGYTNDDGSTVVLSRASLRTGTPAVSITGNVAGGIYLAAPPVNNDSSDDDEDDDGVTDSEEGTASILTYGNGPALQIGGASDITVGGVTGNDGTYSLAIDGSIAANAYYSRTDAYAVVIGGQGGDVTLTQGIGVNGTITATTYDQSATAILINQGSTVSSLTNSGSIIAAISSPGEGSTTAIRDLSGTLTSIENSGYITATGSSTDSTVALDLSANTSGVTIHQYLNDTDAETRAEYEEDNDGETDPTLYARVYGDIKLGSGDDLIDASTGAIIGDTDFGAGDDALTLSGDAAYTGDVAFGTGAATVSLSGTASYAGTMDFAGESASLTLADSATYAGQFAQAGNLSVAVDGGTLIPDEATTVSFGTLTVGANGTLGVYVDGDQSSTFAVTDATLADGASVTATVTDLGAAEGTYTVLTAQNLTLEGTVASSLDLPFLYDGAVSTDDSSVYLTIARKSAGDLGLTRAQGAAWDAIYAAAQNDDSLTASLLEVGDSATLRSQVAGLLPDHAGGVFDAVTQGDRLAARHLSDDTTLFDISDVGGWLEPVYWRSSKEGTGTAGYKGSGWGLSGGVERRTALGTFGASYAWLQGSVTNGGGVGKLDVGQHDFGLFWRTAKGPFLAWARVGAARISVDSTRTFTGTIDDADFTYAADGAWKGWLFSGLAGASYRWAASRRFSVKPKLEVEQMWLKEKGYTETADSDAMALTVAGRTSKALTATPTISAAYSLGTISPDWRPLTFQLEGGRREVLAGSLGKTTAYFNGGDSYDAGDAFTITPDALKGAWIGEASVLAGGYDFTWKLSTRVERTATTTDLSARASLSVAF